MGRTGPTTQSLRTSSSSHSTRDTRLWSSPQVTQSRSSPSSTPSPPRAGTGVSRSWAQPGWAGGAFRPQGGLEHLQERYTLANDLRRGVEFAPSQRLTEATPQTARSRQRLATHASGRNFVRPEEEASRYANSRASSMRRSPMCCPQRDRQEVRHSRQRRRCYSIQSSLTNAVRKKSPTTNASESSSTGSGSFAEATRNRLGEAPEMTTIGITGHINITPETRVMVAREISAILADQGPHSSG